MELLIASGITGIGYYLSSKDQSRTNNSIRVDEQINQNNIYNTNHVNDVKEYEQYLANENFNKAKEPHKTNIVPPEMNNSIHSNEKQYSQLTGDYIDNMSHNNMVPFFWRIIDTKYE
jgi:hypothetical protein